MSSSKIEEADRSPGVGSGVRNAPDEAPWPPRAASLRKNSSSTGFGRFGTSSLLPPSDAAFRRCWCCIRGRRGSDWQKRPGQSQHESLKYAHYRHTSSDKPLRRARDMHARWLLTCSSSASLRPRSCTMDGVRKYAIYGCSRPISGLFRCFTRNASLFGPGCATLKFPHRVRRSTDLIPLHLLVDACSSSGPFLASLLCPQDREKEVRSPDRILSRCSRGCNGARKLSVFVRTLMLF